MVATSLIAARLGLRSVAAVALRNELLTHLLINLASIVNGNWLWLDAHRRLIRLILLPGDVHRVLIRLLLLDYERVQVVRVQALLLHHVVVSCIDGLNTAHVQL